MKTTTYTQCSLKRGNSHHMAWIPTKFAVKGKFIKIKRAEDDWEDGWEVVGVSEGTRTEADTELATKTSRTFGKSIK